MADELNFQVAAEGFGSYLDGILPEDIATSAGAFSASMQQIRNIMAVDFEKFAQVAYSMETTKGLSQVNGTDVPTNKTLASQGHFLTALGSGSDGTYTDSDFFGCMSGLPYMWAELQDGIKSLTTTKLSNIYNQLFLAVTWEKTVIEVAQPYSYTTVNGYVAPTISSNPSNPTYQPNPSLPNYDPYPYLNGSTFAKTYSPTYYSSAGSPATYDWYYTVALTQTSKGGGYGRGSALKPTVVLSPNNVGASVTLKMGENDADAASMGGGSFGRINATISNGGSYRWLANDTQTNWVNIQGLDTTAADPTPPLNPPRSAAWVEGNMPYEYITIQHPPTALLPVTASGGISGGGTNTTGDTRNRNGIYIPGTAGWPSPMNSVVQAYITQANAEIAVIRTTNPYRSGLLNTIYDACGTQLTIEQRARFTGIPPVPSPDRDIWLNLFPTSQYVFVDSVPMLAQNTLPHMYAQTLEAISNLQTPGGNSLVAMMRQERNAARLQEIGIDLDNAIDSFIDPEVQNLLLANGTAPTALEGIKVTGINGDPKEPTTTYTVPSVLLQKDADNNLISPAPVGYVDPNTNTFNVTSGNPTPANVTSPIQQILNVAANNPRNQNLLGPNKNGTGPAIPLDVLAQLPDANDPNGPLAGGSINPSTSPATGGPAGIFKPPVNIKPNLVPLNLQTGSTNLGSTPGSINNPSSSSNLSGAPNNIVAGGPGGAGVPGVTGVPGLGTNIRPGTNAAYQPIAPNIQPIAVVVTGARLPTGSATPIDKGKPAVPGSLAGSKATNLIPNKLNTAYTSGILTPSVYNVDEAIQEVIKCNCDCWVN